MATQQQYPKSARKRATSSGAVQSRAATGQINSGYRFAATTGDNVGDIYAELEAAKRQLAFLPFLKEKFDELVKEHADSKGRYAKKTSQLKEEVSELQDKASNLQIECERFKAENLAKSSEITRLGSELATLRSAKGAVEQQLMESQSQCKQGEQERESLISAHEEQYAVLHDNLLHKRQQASVIAAHASASLHALHLIKLAHAKAIHDASASNHFVTLRLERKLRDKDDQVSQLVDLIIQSEEEQSTYEARIEDLEDDLAQCQQMRTTDNQVFLSERKELRQQLRQAHDIIRELRESQRANQECWNQEKNLLLQERQHLYENLEAQVQALDILPQLSMSNFDLQTSLASARFDLEEAKKSISAREDDIKELQEQLDTARETEEMLSSDLSGCKQTLASTEQELVNEREQRRHLSSLLMQSQATEGQLQEDIFSLQNDLVSYVQLQETHADLIKNLDRLMRTADLAEEDVKELARMNSELAGHNNPNQRIRQLDRLRTELAELKKKHVSSQAELSAQKGKVAALQAEVAAYKSVDHNRPVIAKHLQPLRTSTNIPFQRPLQETGFGHVSLRKGNTLAEAPNAISRQKGPVKSFLS